MKKWVCSICVMFMKAKKRRNSARSARRRKNSREMAAERGWACEARSQRRQGAWTEASLSLRANFNGECSEVGMYLAMARVAHREGYPEIGLYWEKAAYEEAEHAAKFAEMLGEVVTSSTKKNLEMRGSRKWRHRRFRLTDRSWPRAEPGCHPRHRAWRWPRTKTRMAPPSRSDTEPLPSANKINNIRGRGRRLLP